MVEIITDSSVLYTEEDAKAAGFEAIPMCVHIGDMEGRDLKIDMEDLLAYRRGAGSLFLPAADWRCGGGL